ncbi:DUF6551 family protein [Streptomyces sp. NPDC059009]|uniref:DUF6551 family protein n=1 Tax=Streptomyces sp. NPDC059009 TaxID=3346694 RepID=UPI00367720F4
MPTIQRATAIEMIPLSAIVTDPQVNTRPVDDGWVARRLSDGFDWGKFGVPTLSERERGRRYVILDGQNRTALARLAGYADEKIEAKVYRGLALPDEAALFLGLNDSRQVKIIYKFLARLTAKDPDAVAISNAAARHGWEVADQNGTGRILAVAALEKAFRYGEDILCESLSAITDAWGHDADAAAGSIIHGVAMVLYRYGSAIKSADFSKRLAMYPGGATGLVADARGLQRFQGGSVAASLAEVVVNHYNRRRSTGRLPDWMA